MKLRGCMISTGPVIGRMSPLCQFRSELCFLADLCFAHRPRLDSNHITLLLATKLQLTSHGSRSRPGARLEPRTYYHQSVIAMTILPSGIIINDTANPTPQLA